jgi:hypothetical protein
MDYLEARGSAVRAGALVVAALPPRVLIGLLPLGHHRSIDVLLAGAVVPLVSLHRLHTCARNRDR